ncbi:hypothetical protein PFISCL1PPCAC_5650, partial [Pristionchus fissidentatus]
SIDNIDLESFLRQHLNEENTANLKRIEYDVPTIMTICSKMREQLLSEPSLIEFGAPIVIVGDLHGQIRDLQRVLDRFSDGKTHGCLNMRFVFLGDYVDRGYNSFEVVMTLFALKLLFPNCYGLLRGNHETRSLNRIYGFYHEIRERFQDLDTAEEVYLRINDVFDCLPPSALIGGKILCMHGGISPHLKSLDDIRSIQRPIGDLTNNSLMADLLWSDPAAGVPNGMFTANSTRSQSVYWGPEAVEGVCKATGISAVVRAHQFVAAGAAFFADRRVISIFSASNYNAEIRNHGACLHVDEKGRVTIKSFFTFLFSDVMNKDDEMALHDAYLKDDSWLAQAGGEKNLDDTVDPNHNSDSSNNSP